MTQTSCWDLTRLLLRMSWAGGGFSPPAVVGGSSRRPQGGSHTKCAPDGVRAGMHQAGPGWAGGAGKGFSPFHQEQK